MTTALTPTPTPTPTLTASILQIETQTYVPSELYNYVSALDVSSTAAAAPYNDIPVMKTNYETLVSNYNKNSTESARRLMTATAATNKALEDAKKQLAALQTTRETFSDVQRCISLTDAAPVSFDNMKEFAIFKPTYSS